MTSRRKLHAILVMVCIFVFAVDAKSISLDSLAGKISAPRQNGFAPIPSNLSARKGMLLRTDALHAFEKMVQAARRDGIRIYAISAFRSWYDQKRIWEAKFLGKRLVGGMNLKTAYPNEERRALKILMYSSMPGTSRHHWGTDIDLGYDRTQTGKMLMNSTYSRKPGSTFYTWLQKNAGKYGFCQPYNGSPLTRNPGQYRRGYQEERWHWSYAPLAQRFLKEYRKHLKNLKPSGFAGANAGAKFYQDYVFNINPECDRVANSFR